MCSVGWVQDGAGYRLWFNRDEQWSRPLSRAPEILRNQRVPILCATDPAGGGTWLATNTAGITLAILNSYQERPLLTAEVCPKPVSRGQIPLLTSLGETSAEIVTALEKLSWENYAPCWILLLVPMEKARLWHWDGEKLDPDMPLERPFLTTSSVDPATICQLRRERFEILRTGKDEAHLFDDTDEFYPAAGIYMSRIDAGTVSQTRVEVTVEKVTLSVRRRGEEFLTITSERTA